MGKMIEDGKVEVSCPLILETSVIVFENQRETEETGGGGKEGKAGSWSGGKTFRLEFQSE